MWLGRRLDVHHLNDNNTEVGRVLSTISALETCESLPDILALLSEFSKSYGFIYAGIGQIVNPAVLPNPICDYGITDFPEDFKEAWIEKLYIIHDPVLRHALTCQSIFTWQDAYESATDFGRKIFEEAKDYGMVDGVAIPVRIGRYPTGLVSLVHSSPNFSAEELARIQLVAVHACTQLIRILNAEQEDQTIVLTKREVEVLQYVAGGKTNWEVGKIFGITEDAIKMHMKNINRKLDASNRAHSVSIGIRLGQIMP